MTFELLSKVIEENNIPKDVKLMSDSGWECSATEMDGIFYNEEENILIFTQKGDWYDRQFNMDMNCVYGELKDYKDKNGYDYYECDEETCINNVDGVCHRSDRENCYYFK